MGRNKDPLRMEIERREKRRVICVEHIDILLGGA